MTLRRNAGALGLCLAALFAAGCANKSSLNPPVGTTASRHQTAMHVVVHRTYEREASNIHGAAGSAYRGNVVTVPAPVPTPSDVTYDQDDGNFYALVQHQGNSAIDKITPSGTETTFLQFGYELNGIVYDHATSEFYVTTNDADVNNQFTYYPAVYAVTSSGQFSVLAGGLTSGFQDGQGTGASFTYVTGITLDSSNGLLYVADEDRLRAVTTGGSVTTLTPGGSIGRGYPQHRTGIAWDSVDGNLYVADSNADNIKKVTTSGGVAVLAGQCIQDQFYQCTQLQRNGKGTDALFATPTGIAAGGNGDLYVSDSGNNTVRQITTAGTVTTLAGSGIAGTVDGAGLNAEMESPLDLTYENGMLYELEAGSYSAGSSIRSITTTGNPPPPPSTPITLFDTRTPAAQPFAIDWRQPSSQLWYTELTGKIASLSAAGTSKDYKAAPQPQPGDATDIVLGTDGTPWFTDPVDAAVSHLTKAGRVRQYAMHNRGYYEAPNVPDSMVYGPGTSITLMDSNLVDTITPQGVMTSFSFPQQYAPNNIAFSGDGSLWGLLNSSIYRSDMHGNLVGIYNIQANFITEAPDGDILFTQNDLVGKIIVATGVVDEYPIYQSVPNCYQNQNNCTRGIGRITTGPDGAYWFTENQIGYIGRLDPNSGFSEYPVYAAHVSPFDIVPGPDGNVWFTDTGAQKIGRIKAP